MSLVYFSRTRRFPPQDGSLWSAVYVNPAHVTAVDAEPESDGLATRVALMGAGNILYVDLPVLEVVKALGGATNLGES